MVAGRKRKFFRTDSKTIADRVHKGALRMLKNKFAQNKGGDYEDLSLSAKVDVDQMVKKRKNLLSNIESRLMTSYKQKMAMRKKNQTQNPQRKV